MPKTKRASAIKTGDVLLIENHCNLTTNRFTVLNVTPYSTHSVAIDHSHRHGGPLMVIDKTEEVTVEG